jgi:hypothetical protein
MDSRQRLLKKIAIIFIIISVIAVIIFISTRPKTDPCFDKRKDNGETGVDCGGFCEAICVDQKPKDVKDIKINWAKYVEDGRNNYDLIASVSNENQNWGVVNVNYEFTYYNDSGKVIGKKQGKTYIMPRGKSTDPSDKYIIENGIKTSEKPAKVDINLSNYQWSSIKDVDLDALSENIIQISQKDFKLDKNIKSYLATGTTKNTSKYDFQHVDIDVVVLGKKGEILGTGKTTQLTMSSGNGWGFFVWIGSKIDENELDHVDYRAETNVLDKNNFMKEYQQTN